MASRRRTNRTGKKPLKGGVRCKTGGGRNEKPGAEPGLYLQLFKSSRGAKGPSDPKRGATTYQFRLLNNRGPPFNEVLSFAPVRHLAPLLRKTEDRKPAFPKCFAFGIPFGEFVLGYNRPSPFSLER